MMVPQKSTSINTMNVVTRVIHNFVIKTKAEELFISLRRRINIIRKLIPVGLRHKVPSVGKAIPGASAYPKDDCYSLIRDHVHFRINRSDYVQWRLFYGVRDNALREAKKNLEDGNVILDIGSNFGAFSLKLASYAKEKEYSKIQIHAFEPNPIAIENFENNLALNKELANIIYLHPYGLGNEMIKHSFQYVESNTGAGRIVRQPDSRLVVQIRTLDDFVQELNPGRIDFIKLIVEGFEPQVFEGGWETIKKYKPPVFFEVTEAWWRENNYAIPAVLGKLTALGYRFMIEHHNEMIPFEPARFSGKNQYNLLATI
jgi:FkbM family methyltransferase